MYLKVTTLTITTKGVNLGLTNAPLMLLNVNKYVQTDPCFIKTGLQKIYQLMIMVLTIIHDRLRPSSHLH